MVPLMREIAIRLDQCTFTNLSFTLLQAVAFYIYAVVLRSVGHKEHFCRKGDYAPERPSALLKG